MGDAQAVARALVAQHAYDSPHLGMVAAVVVQLGGGVVVQKDAHRSARAPSVLHARGPFPGVVVATVALRREIERMFRGGVAVQVEAVAQPLYQLQLGGLLTVHEVFRLPVRSRLHGHRVIGLGGIHAVVVASHEDVGAPVLVAGVVAVEEIGLARVGARQDDPALRVEGHRLAGVRRGSPVGAQLAQVPLGVELGHVDVRVPLGSKGSFVESGGAAVAPREEGEALGAHRNVLPAVQLASAYRLQPVRLQVLVQLQEEGVHEEVVARGVHLADRDFVPVHSRKVEFALLPRRQPVHRVDLRSRTVGRIRNRAVRIEARHEKVRRPRALQLRVPQQRDHHLAMAFVHARRVVLILAGVVGAAAAAAALVSIVMPSTTTGIAAAAAAALVLVVHAATAAAKSTVFTCVMTIVLFKTTYTTIYKGKT